jgi:hypothetical protein
MWMWAADLQDLRLEYEESTVLLKLDERPNYDPSNITQENRALRRTECIAEPCRGFGSAKRIFVDPFRDFTDRVACGMKLEGLSIRSRPCQL